MFSNLFLTPPITQVFVDESTPIIERKRPGFFLSKYILKESKRMLKNDGWKTDCTPRIFQVNGNSLTNRGLVDGQLLTVIDAGISQLDPLDVLALKPIDGETDTSTLRVFGGMDSNNNPILFSYDENGDKIIDNGTYSLDGKVFSLATML